MKVQIRQVVLDTETTGISPRDGNRIIEIGCVEIVDRKLTGNNYHQYINPERDSEEGALQVHGLTTEFLADKPRFAEISAGFIEYIRGAEVIIHNAPFDLGFLNAEFSRLNLGNFEDYVAGVTDTLVQAKELHPGKRNSLDALCDRYGISNAHRQLHGALLDSELLADVFLAMSRGQNSLMMDADDSVAEIQVAEVDEKVPLPSIFVLKASEIELQEHDSLLNGLDKQNKQPCIWRQ